MIRSIIIFQWAFACLLIACSGKSDAGIFDVADSLLAEGKADSASLAYEQILFGFPGNSDILAEGLLKKTECLKIQGKYDHVEVLLKRINIESVHDSIKARIYYEKALSNYLSGNIERAERNILPVFNLSFNDENLLTASTLLHCFILNESGRWNEAHFMVNKFIADKNNMDSLEKKILLEQVDQYYAKDKIPKMKSIKKARNMSLLFPGLGQAYNGNYLKGLESLSLVSLSGIYIAYNIINATYITAATAGVYSFLYFYFGGANQSNKLVPSKNYRRKFEYNNYLRTNLTLLSTKLYQNDEN